MIDYLSQSFKLIKIILTRRQLVYRALCQILKEDSGGSAAEYGLVASLIAIVIITGVVWAGTSVSGLFNFIGSEVSNALPITSTLR